MNDNRKTYKSLTVGLIFSMALIALGLCLQYWNTFGITFLYTGLGPTIGFLIFTIFSLGILYLTYIALKVLDRGYKKNTGKSILGPLFLIISMSGIWTVLRQAVSSNIIVFSNDKTELVFNVILSGTYILFASAVLYKVLKDIKVLDNK
ncbi:hypothetical protein [Acinetobacter sp. TGL-Y2]|uniref:hypothetical protein n=1 Tax=Acinetobacter sp. TGL-Y2 TaxID=1407071 RepID=UPI000B24BDF3|nr:hypothetical protein [Acinetobacter sp. TGL-Y2]